MHIYENFFEKTGVFSLVFIVVGAGAWINILLGLVPGGPRDQLSVGSPVLFDRTYYLLWLVGMTGWTFGLACFPIDGSAGFMIGWGICAIGMGLLFGLRGDIIIRE